MARQQQAVMGGVKPRFSALRVISALMLREMSTTYGRSPGGYVWAVLEPAAGIALLTLIFSAGFRAPPLGTNFPLFYAAGMLPFGMYTELTNKLGSTIQFNRQLLSYPRVTFVDAVAARFALNLLTQMMVHFVVLGFIMIVMRPDTAFDYTKIAQAYAVVIVLSAGIGVLNCFLFLAYPIWRTAWTITNRPLFLASGIFFLFEIVPEPYSTYLWYNPLVHVIGHMRDGYYPFYTPSYVSLVYPLMIGGVAGMAGLFLLNRYHKDILLK